ncbi:MAG: glycosyltransferase family 4 protein [Thermoleophilaceae bacterium]|nr:glycosyltransferase family 4 protein [Thermoleophilaceae bacterium]
MAGLADQRVLVLHNRYRIAGGEERYAAQLVDLLGRRAGGISLLERSSGDTTAVEAGIGMLRGGIDPDQVSALVKESGATIVHAHNVHPTLGHRALAAAREAGAATVLHLHNYRLFCAIGTVWRAGADCTECAPRRMSRGLIHNCRGSIPEAVTYAAGLSRGQAPLIDAVDRFAAPVAQLGDDLAALGFDLPLTVLPSWLPDSEFVRSTQAGDGEYALFVGRISTDKGILVAIAAAAESGIPLRVAGDGPDALRARKLVDELQAPVDFLGRIDGQALVAARMGAAFALVPSEWREVLPLSALESLAAGLPLLTSDRGGLPELTEPELVTPAGDASALAAAMRRLMDDPAERAAAGARALDRAREQYSEAAFEPRLAKLYEAALAARASAG